MISKHERLPSGDCLAVLRSCKNTTGSLQPAVLLCSCLLARLPCIPGNARHDISKREAPRQLRLSLALQEPIHADAERAGRVSAHEEGPGL